MDERLRICLWMLGCGGIGAILGGAFGAMTGYLYHESGGVAGTRFGRWVADSLAHTAEHEPSSAWYAVLVGAADGFLFLGVLGLCAGIAVALCGQVDASWLGMAALGSALLVGLAAFFGTLAYAMTRYGSRALLFILGGGLFGSMMAGSLLGVNDTLFGTVPGFLLGLALTFVTRRYTPTFRPPNVGEPVSPRHTDTDAIRKPGEPGA